MSGKGSAPRPFSVSDEEYANRWDAIFGRKNRALGALDEELRKADDESAQMELPLEEDKE